ncbi:hypothetical protein AB4865_02815 [Capnocytophaga sp. ARDL2]|uniref:hypothetical protein n=1 Tax=Capnocytophaga sp. ARDL2 TaxID=3238809 RepID=UPI003558F729
MNGAESNIGYLFNESQYLANSIDNLTTTYTIVEKVNDDYACSKPTLIIRPISNDDNLVESFILTDTSHNFTIPPFYQFQPEWQKQGWSGFLTFNIDYRKVQDEDILKVTIPRIRLTDYYSTIFAPTTISIIKASPNLIIDDNSNLIFPLSSHSNLLVSELDIKRKKIRNKEWIDVNILWDDDWNMHEGEQAFILVSHHTFGGSISVNGSVKLGWNSTTKKPTADPNLNVSFDMSLGKRRELRYNNNVSRRSLLTHIVNDSGAGVFAEGKVKYTVRTAGALEYYFKPHLTKNVTERIIK